MNAVQTFAPGQVCEVPLAAIHVNGLNSRKHFDEVSLAELAGSIGRVGILQRLVARNAGKNSAPPSSAKSKSFTSIAKPLPAQPKSAKGKAKK